MDIVIAFFAGLILFWIAKVFYILQKSLNEITKGLSSLDERLYEIEKNTRR